jgi:urate oxidase
MILSANKYGKARVRILRVRRDAPIHTVSELSVNAMLQGDFSRAYTDADNRGVVATDSIKNLVNITAREQVDLDAENFCLKLSEKFLSLYPQVERVLIDTWETQWQRAVVGGVPQPHSFWLNGNGKPTVRLEQSRDALTLSSGVEGLTFMNTTGSGWADYVIDDFTTLPQTQDRIIATAMNASWRWVSPPGDAPPTNDKIVSAMLNLFATSYSHGVQDSLYRMGVAALEAAPEISEISLACPNKHYLPINLSPFGLAGDNRVFTPTDEPHGQIECFIRR